VGKNEYVTFDCISVKQPIGDFYIGTINSANLIKIAYSDIRRIQNKETRDVEKYLGIQRPLSPGRVAELKEYVNNMDATFPTSIIIAVSSRDALYDANKKTMSLKNDTNVAKIIDGQHRIKGLEDYNSPIDFQLNVTVFVDMDIEDQAMVFATINLKQTKVNKSLATDLFEFTKARSPQKTCHNIAKLLNEKENSPFKNKIKILGVATGKSQESITQATFVDRLIKFISRRPMRDRDLIKRSSIKKLKRPEGKDLNKLIFRNLFIEDRDAEIAKNIWNYFKAVEAKWPNSWMIPKQGNILCRTTGFGALMSFMGYAYNHLGGRSQVFSVSEYGRVINVIKLKDDEFTPDVFKPGSSGESKLRKLLISQSGI